MDTYAADLAALTESLDLVMQSMWGIRPAVVKSLAMSPPESRACRWRRPRFRSNADHGEVRGEPARRTNGRF